VTTLTIREVLKDRIAAQRAAVSCLSQFQDIQKIIREAASLKHETVRHQVQEIIRCGLENADDTCAESCYARECERDFVDFKTDYPTRAAWWESMFYGSAQSMSTEGRYLFGRDLHGNARRWLQRRGLMG
jgi:hypothetical protein